MSLKEIVEKENTKTDPSEIFLFREGIFLKAYQQSAYLFHRFIKPYQVKQVYYKGIDQTLHSLGFPSNVFENIVGQQNLYIEQAEDNRIVIRGKELVFCESDYAAFKETYLNDEVIIRQRGQMEHQNKEAVKIVSVKEHSIIERLTQFNVVDSSPMDCMLFVNELKKSLHEQLL